MKFVILHHSACPDGPMHYCVCTNGDVAVLLPEASAGASPRCIGVRLEGDFGGASPDALQLQALEALLVGIKRRFPDIQVGGHRQIRGARTECPGAKFPLRDVRNWSASDLVLQRDAWFMEEVDRQYRH